MHRNVSKEDTIELITKIRETVPGIHIRTTLMVGFPGETDEDFSELVDFVKWARFERMGAFAYSEEEGTYSAEHYDDNVEHSLWLSMMRERLELLNTVCYAYMGISNINREILNSVSFTPLERFNFL